MKKGSHIRSDIYEQTVLDFVKQKSPTTVGVEFKDILSYVQSKRIVQSKRKGKTRQTVTSHLNNLEDKGEIKRTIKGRYLTKEVFNERVYDGWSYLEDFLNTQHPFFIADRRILDLEELKLIMQDLATQAPTI